MRLKTFTLFITVFTFFSVAHTHLYAGAVSDGTGSTIKGKVVDKTTLEPIEAAVVTDKERTSLDVTDKGGTFLLKSIKGDSLYITVLGYKPRIVTIVPGKPVIIEMERGAIALKDVTITNSSTFRTYSAFTALDLNIQPAKSAQDLLRLVPGLFIAQHQGGGKAEQIFLRGFDADHGTDVNVSVDGLPVNMVSHVHGQGYADMHFVIPETIAGYDFGKGPYYADKGDFTTAGYVAYNTKPMLENNLVKIEAGQYNTLRMLAMFNLLNEKAKKKGTSAYIAGERLYSNGGPFTLPEHFTRYNLFGKFNTKVGYNSRLTIMASALASTWRSAGEVPDRAVSNGYLANRFGVLDTAQGGRTTRANASIKLTTELGNDWIMENQLWYSHYYFNLVTNFTFYYYFPLTGDEFRQKDERDLAGYNWKVRQTKIVDNTTYTSTIGAAFRYDNIYPLELDHTENGHFLSYAQYGRAKELNANTYIDETVRRGKWLFDAGLRLDVYNFYYQNLAPATDTFASKIYTGINHNTIQKAILCPKASAEYTFSNQWQLYLKAGKGFHSNDARVVVGNKGVDVLPAAYGADLGINWKPLPNLFINTAIWYLYLQQEFTFGQDLIAQPGGPISPSGSTVRKGIDLSARYQLTSWLFANGNINVARPRFIDSAKGHDYVPLAPTLTSTASIDYKFKNGINGGISYRYLHNRAANGDYSLTARGYFITDLTINYTRKKYEVGMAIENLFNRAWDESQFEYTSRLYNETKPVDQVSYTPGVPFFLKVHISYKF